MRFSPIWPGFRPHPRCVGETPSWGNDLDGSRRHDQPVQHQSDEGLIPRTTFRGHLGSPKLPTIPRGFADVLPVCSGNRQPARSRTVEV